ncbi:MAG: metallophosphoesterase [Clostridia bacterium]|nr:metallophosphoesterase [Clostridia bacterium]
MIFATGDMHGDYKKLKKAIKRCKKGDFLLICGDFGFLWDGTPAEKKTLTRIGKSKVRVCFVDGSNENFDLLAKYPVQEFCGGKASNISGNLWYLRRGEVYLMEDRSIFCFGGAKSDDAETKQAGGHWYAEEMPNIEQMQNGYDNLKRHHFKVDCLLTHQPSGSIYASLEDSTIDCDGLQVYLDEINREVDYKVWVFGRLHRDRRITYKHFAVFGDVLPLNGKKGIVRKQEESA